MWSFFFLSSGGAQQDSGFLAMSIQFGGQGVAVLLRQVLQVHGRLLGLFLGCQGLCMAHGLKPILVRVLARIRVFPDAPVPAFLVGLRMVGPAVGVDGMDKEFHRKEKRVYRRRFADTRGSIMVKPRRR
ncbi:hypothetical protein LC612_30485 [Nostoc sp. CHAB 5834]|nr:hypothetical protein [Nostoc sp. CHAB 5834]